jgi:hypothetical protein
VVVKLELKPEVQAGLQAEAQARGLSLEEYLEQVVRDHTVSVPTVSAEAWEREFEAWVASFPEGPALSDEAISRESMYPDRW